MSNNFKISKQRLAEIIREEYALIREELGGGEVNEREHQPENPTPTAGDDVAMGSRQDQPLSSGESDENQEKTTTKGVQSIRDLIRQEISRL